MQSVSGDGVSRGYQDLKVRGDGITVNSEPFYLADLLVGFSGLAKAWKIATWTDAMCSVMLFEINIGKIVAEIFEPHLVFEIEIRVDLRTRITT